MGCPAAGKLTGNVIPDFPGPNEDIPIKAGADEPLMRFRWDQSADFAYNHDNLKKIVAEIMRNGSQYVPGAETLLKEILEPHMVRSVKGKFDRLRATVKSYKKMQKKANTTVDADIGVAVENGTAQAQESGAIRPPADNRQKLDSRRKGVCPLSYPILPTNTKYLET
jgi:hypothetical protein